MSVALVMELGMAAPLAVSGLPRFHALDWVGMPLCMSLIRPPIYPIDFASQTALTSVPPDLRCHRAGCLEAWPADALV